MNTLNDKADQSSLKPEEIPSTSAESRAERTNNMTEASNEGQQESRTSATGGQERREALPPVQTHSTNSRRKSRSHGLTPMPAYYEPSEHDVICAKGNDAKNHPGNKVLRGLILSHLDEYKVLESRTDRAFIVSAIVNNIKKQGGRFVRKFGEGWADVGARNSREKIGASFRDLLYEQYSSSAKAKASRRKQQSTEAIKAKNVDSDSAEPQSENQAQTSPSHASKAQVSASIAPIAGRAYPHEYVAGSARPPTARPPFGPSLFPPPYYYPPHVLGWGRRPSGSATPFARPPHQDGATNIKASEQTKGTHVKEKALSKVQVQPAQPSFAIETARQDDDPNKEAANKGRHPKRSSPIHGSDNVNTQEATRRETTDSLQHGKLRKSTASCPPKKRRPCSTFRFSGVAHRVYMTPASHIEGRVSMGRDSPDCASPPHKVAILEREINLRPATAPKSRRPCLEPEGHYVGPSSLYGKDPK